MNFVGLGVLHGLQGAGYRVTLGHEWEPSLSMLGYQRKGADRAAVVQSFLDECECRQNAANRFINEMQRG